MRSAARLRASVGWAELREVLLHPVFLAVLAAKLLASLVFSSSYTEDLFLPVVAYWVDSGFANPWDHFAAEGNLKAFPYSSGMLFLVGLPTVLPGLMFGAADLPMPVKLLLLRLPLVLADVGIYLILSRWFAARRHETLVLYWCSPVLFFISYVHGQLDAIPTALLFGAIAALLSSGPALAGALLGLGISTKLHVAVAVPFFLAYLWRHGASSEARARAVAICLAAMLLVLLALVGPWLGSAGYRQLVLGADEMGWVYQVALPMGTSRQFFLAPAAVFALMVHFFSYRRVSQDLLVLYLGLVFTALILFVPPMPGWAFWSVPFLCYFVIRERMSWFLPFWTYAGCYLVYFGAVAPGVRVVPEGWVAAWDPATFARLGNLAFTGMQASLGLVALWMAKAGVGRYGIAQGASPSLAVGIGGDSGSGKHTLANLLADVVGERSVVSLFGDDYHRWERGDPNWETVTHLDPNSNEFRQPARDLAMLKQGSPIRVARYDHERGRFSTPVRLDGQPYVFFVGLHPFVFQRTRDLFDLRIFVDTDDDLRRRWKVQRDVAARGHAPDAVLAQMDQRVPDADRFVAPQVRHATWVVRYEPDAPLDGAPVSLKVVHRIASDFVGIQQLAQRIDAVSGGSMTVAWTVEDNLEYQRLSVFGTLSAAQVAQIAREVVPDLAGMLMQHSPRWHGGVDGLSQLVFLCLLDELRTLSSPSGW